MINHLLQFLTLKTVQQRTKKSSTLHKSPFQDWYFKTNKQKSHRLFYSQLSKSARLSVKGQGVNILALQAIWSLSQLLNSAVVGRAAMHEWAWLCSNKILFIKMVREPGSQCVTSALGRCETNQLPPLCKTPFRFVNATIIFLPWLYQLLICQALLVLFGF